MIKTEVKKEIKTFRIEWKWKHNIPKPVGQNEGGSRCKFTALSAYIKNKKLERSSISNLTAYIKALEPKEEITLKRSRHTKNKLKADTNKQTNKHKVLMKQRIGSLRKLVRLKTLSQTD